MRQTTKETIFYIKRFVGRARFAVCLHQAISADNPDAEENDANQRLSSLLADKPYWVAVSQAKGLRLEYSGLVRSWQMVERCETTTTPPMKG